MGSTAMVPAIGALFFLLLLSLEAWAVPVVHRRTGCPNYELNVDSPDQCYLPPKLGGFGTRKFLEDCEGLERFKTVPKPLFDHSNSFGVHPVVCCPKPLPSSSTCFPSDPWCETYEEKNYDYENYDYDYNNYEDCQQDSEGGKRMRREGETGLNYGASPRQAMMEEGDCRDSECVPLTQCKSLDSPDAPQHSYPCGFDTSLNLLKVCCPPENVTQPQIEAQPARFPKSGQPRRVEDKTELCSKWRRNEGCRLDKHFLISDLDDDPYNGNVYSRDMFDFMQRSCARTCGWVESGCHDEHPRCEDWARRGMCVTSGMLMAHTCRESCGVCGLLAPENKEIQTQAGRSYTDFTLNNFDCGGYKLLSDIRGAEKESSNKEIKCSNSIITDRWMVGAAHCFNEFQNNQGEITVNTLRDGTPLKEVIEVKRVYQHPNYEYPKQYDDIAVVELGRRIAYDYEKVGGAGSLGLSLSDSSSTETAMSVWSRTRRRTTVV